MKKLSLFILFSIALASTTAAQKVAFLPKWKKGDTHTYYFFYNKYNPKNTEYKVNQDTTLLTLKVLETTANGYVLQMQQNFSKHLPKPFPSAGLKKVIEEVQQTSIEFELDKNGRLSSIRNWQELKKRSETLLDAGKKSADSNEKETWEYWKTKVQTQEQIEKFFAHDIEFFFMLYGSEVVENTSFEYEDEMESPYDSDYLPANTNLINTKDSANNLVYKVQLYTLPDQVKAAEKIKQYREIAKQQEDEPDAIPLAYLFDLQDYYEYVHNTKNGLHTKAVYLRYLKTGSKDLIEEWIFKLVP